MELFPADVILLISQDLILEDAISLSRTCKYFYSLKERIIRAVSTGKIWTEIFFLAIRRFMRKYPYVRDFRIEKSIEMTRRIANLLYLCDQWELYPTDLPVDMNSYLLGLLTRSGWSQKHPRPLVDYFFAYFYQEKNRLKKCDQEWWISIKSIFTVNPLLWETKKPNYRMIGWIREIYQFTGSSELTLFVINSLLGTDYQNLPISLPDFDPDFETRYQYTNYILKILDTRNSKKYLSMIRLHERHWFELVKFYLTFKPFSVPPYIYSEPDLLPDYFIFENNQECLEFFYPEIKNEKYRRYLRRKYARLDFSKFYNPLF